MTLPRSDTRLLIAGVAAFLALVAYLAVALATAHPSANLATNQSAGGATHSKAQVVGPWHGRASHLVRVPRTTGGGLAVRVTPLTRGLYGAEIQQLVLPPALRRGFALSVWLRGRGPSRLLVQVNTGGLAPPIRYLVKRTVVASRRWRRFTYHGRFQGRGTGIGLFVGQTTHTPAGRWFEVRDVSVRASRG